ncbi:hypothetical protein [Vulcanisaeta sp. JCM 14467]|uniref:hypothetical protein n=1 Tax=Vulcanisaeta sp. JCM 14467 TaxID=1295370 RepID=UPI0006D2B193|nr:hypothetical protein [Vulcanisaeta sp. JCM 14467]
MPINKSLALRALIITLILLSIFLSSANTASGGYVGFYSTINWPVISVSIVNGTQTSSGVIIVISPREIPSQQYEAFTGIGLIGGDYLLVNGIIYANGTISIAEFVPVNTSVSPGITGSKTTTQSSINITAYPSDYELIGQRAYHVGQLVRESSINTIMAINTNTSAIYNGHKQLMSVQSGNIHTKSTKARNTYAVIYVMINFSLIATIALIALLMIAPILRYQVYDNRECINELFIRFVRRLGVKDPSLTHRDIRNYLMRYSGVNNEAIDKAIYYYELAVYGNKPLSVRNLRR